MCRGTSTLIWRQIGANLAPNWRHLALCIQSPNWRHLAPNWRHLAVDTVFPEKCAPPRGGTAKYRQNLAFLNRQVAPIGATWRHLAPKNRQIGANLAPNWRQCAVAKFWRQMAPKNRQVAPIWRQLAPLGAKLAPKSAHDLNSHTTHPDSGAH